MHHALTLTAPQACPCDPLCAPVVLQAGGAVSNIAMQPYGPYPGAAGYQQGQPVGGGPTNYPAGPSGPYGSTAAATGPSHNPFGVPRGPPKRPMSGASLAKAAWGMCLEWAAAGLRTMVGDHAARP